jgi:hypothetical protein
MSPNEDRAWWQDMPLPEFQTRVLTMPESILMDLRRELKAATRKIALDLEVRGSTNATWYRSAKIALSRIAIRGAFVGTRLAILGLANKESDPTRASKRDRHEKHMTNLREAAIYNEAGDLRGAIAAILAALLPEG